MVINKRVFCSNENGTSSLISLPSKWAGIVVKMFINHIVMVSVFDDNRFRMEKS